MVSVKKFGSCCLLNVTITSHYIPFLYSNHTETIIKYFVTDLNNHKTQNRSGHLKKTRVERDASNGSCIP